MNKYFNIKDKIYYITEKYPETIDVFVGNGFEQFKDDDMRKTMGNAISLKMALSMRNIDQDDFRDKLVDAIEENRKKTADIRIDGVLPCPVQTPLLDIFNNWMEGEENLEDTLVDYNLKSASIGVDWIKEEIKSAKSEEEIADIFISAGFDLFFDEKLMGKFKSRNIFEDLMGRKKLNSDFDNNDINLFDPDRQYSIIGVVPAVFLINTEALDGRKIPRTWEDILKPEWKNSVSLPIGDFDLFNAMLLTIYKNYGDEGIEKLGVSLLRSMHPSEMVKSHMKKAERPAITIMPYFFSKMAKVEGPMEAVWPEDGAIISPIFLLSKESKKDQLKPFVDLFASKEVGELLAHNGRFPSTNPDVDNRVPKDQKYMWLGWDYIKNNDIGKLIKHCENIFYKSMKEEEIWI